MGITSKNNEAHLQTAVASYLRLQYPDVLFHSDFGSGIKMTKGQAIKQKRQNGGLRGWPDMFIAQPTSLCHGLFIELKREGTRLLKKNDDWATPHIAEQAEILEKLRDLGYAAEFAVGFDEAKTIIDGYLKGGKKKKNK